MKFKWAFSGAPTDPGAWTDQALFTPFRLNSIRTHATIQETGIFPIQKMNGKSEGAGEGKCISRLIRSDHRNGTSLTFIVSIYNLNLIIIHRLL